MIPKMPDEYKGVYIFSSAYTKSDGTNNGSRKWTKEEEEWVMNLIDEGFSLSQIAVSTDREIHSVSMKVKRLKKKTGAYNEKHIQQKYDSNKEFYDLLQPKSILDCFSGIKRYWKCIEPNTIDNDINTDLESDNHLDANVLMSQLISEGKLLILTHLGVRMIILITPINWLQMGLSLRLEKWVIRDGDD